MLIEYLFEKLPDWEGSSGQAIGDLEVSRKDDELICRVWSPFVIIVALFSSISII